MFWIFKDRTVMALVENWLKGDEVIDVEGYLWIYLYLYIYLWISLGRNGRSLHSKAVRGLGGVGLLICKGVLEGRK